MKIVMYLTGDGALVGAGVAPAASAAVASVPPAGASVVAVVAPASVPPAAVVAVAVTDVGVAETAVVGADVPPVLVGATEAPGA